MARVMLVNPPFTQSEKSAKRCIQPLGLLSLASYLDMKGHEVRILDSVVEGYNQNLVYSGIRQYGLSNNEIVSRIIDYNPDYLGISVLMTPNSNSALRICKDVKERGLKAETILGGAHPSFAAEEIINNYSYIDHIVVGEGEESLRKIVECDTGGIVTSPLIDMNELPIPNRNFIPMEKYFKINMHENTYSPYKRTAMLESSRGCPFNCCFCATSNLWGRKFRSKSIDKIREEIEYLLYGWRVKELDFLDPNMAYDKERMIELLIMMVELQDKYKFAWGNFGGTYVNGLSDLILRLIKESGGYQISLAIENVNEHILYKVIGKPIKLDRVQGIVDRCKKIGLDLHAFFVTGFPEESLEEMWNNYHFAKKMGFTSASFNIVSPILGSRIYEKYKEHVNPMNISFNEVTIPHPTLTNEKIEHEVNRMNIEFNKGLWHRNPVLFFKKYWWWGGIKRGRIPFFRRQ